jgi:hypothetical protein
VALESQLRGSGTRFSSRRLSMLFRTALGIHAARLTLAHKSDDAQVAPDWETTLFLALAHGHPGLACGPIDRGTLLALHRHAWNIAGLKNDDPWKELLNIADPVERVAVACRASFPLSQADLSSIVLEAVAAQPTPESRAALSLVLYLTLRSSPKIAATAAETLASQLTRVLRPNNATHAVYGRQLTHCREVANLCSSLGDTARDRYTRNLLHAFLPDGFSGITPALLQSTFSKLWTRFGLEDGDHRTEA